MSDNQQFCLRWNNHQSTLVQVIDSLLSSGVLVDCTLAAEGQFLHAHKVVLCACSPYLETLLSQHYEKHPIVILKDVKFQELKSMMDYMYKGEVNISQDQLGQFLKAAESLQIKGLTDGGGENDSRDVGSTSQKRHEPTPVRKAVPHQSRSPLVLPSHNTGLTIEPSKRSLPSHLSESQPDSPIRSREGSSSPTSRKRRRQRRPSQGDEDGHQDNSCDLPMQAQTMSITTVPTSIPPLPSGSSSTITKAPPPDEDSENPDSDRLSGLPAEGYIKEKIEPQPEMLIEPKTEYMEETNNDDSVEDLTLDDDDDYENMMESGPGPSHSGNNPNDSYATWQMTGDRQDEAYLNPADTGHRDSQGSKIGTCEFVVSKSKYFTEIDSTRGSVNAIDEIMKTPERGRSVASYGLRGKIYKRSRFFYGLPYEKQIILLRRTKNMTNTSTEFAQKLSDELHLSFQSVASWLSRKRLKNMRILQNPGLTPVKTQLLRELFQLSNELNEEKALLFGYELELPADTVRKWFECEKLNATRHHFICYEDDELPTGEAASNEISVSLDVDNSCSPVGTEMMDVSSEDTEKFLFSKSVALKISKYRNKFFYGLPFAKQIALLENSRYLTTNHVNLAQKLSSRLNLPFENVFSWLSRKRYRNLKLLESTKVTPYQNLLLEDEFQLSNALDEKRVLMLSYELELPVDKIQEWFDYQRSRSVEKNVSTEDSDCEEQRQNFETSDS